MTVRGYGFLRIRNLIEECKFEKLEFLWIVALFLWIVALDEKYQEIPSVSEAKCYKHILLNKEA